VVTPSRGIGLNWPDDGVNDMARKSRRVRSVIDQLNETVPTFSLILNSETLPFLATLIQFGKELCAARLEEMTPRLVQDGAIESGQLTYQLLYYTCLHSQSPPKVGQDAIEREIESIKKGNRWSHVKDQLRLVAVKLADKLAEIETATRDISDSSTESLTKPVKIKSKHEARNKWIYQQCRKGTEHDDIVIALEKIAAKRKWKPVGTKQRIQQIGKKYAKDHGIDPPLPRRNL
jgi:hypothetical protein